MQQRLRESFGTLNDLASKLLSWAMPAVVGALLVLVINSKAEQQQTERNAQDIVALQADIKALRTEYATNKRVDDVQAELRENYRTLGAKLDNIIQLLLERSKR